METRFLTTGALVISCAVFGAVWGIGMTARAGVHDDFSDATRRSWSRPAPSPTNPPVADPVTPAEAQSVLEQLDDLDLWDDLDPLGLGEITPLGNVVLPGAPQLVVVYCRRSGEEPTATVTDLTPEHSAPASADLQTAIGSRCYATYQANRRRGLPKEPKELAQCMTLLCYDSDALYRKSNPPPQD